MMNFLLSITPDVKTDTKKKRIIKIFSSNDYHLFRSATIVISVQNINEFTPQFEGLPYSLQVAENAAQGTSVGVIRASDRDGDKVTFTLAEGDTGNSHILQFRV